MFALSATETKETLVDALNYALSNLGGPINVQDYIISVGASGNLLINLNGNNIASFSPGGNLVISGSLTQNSTPT